MDYFTGPDGERVTPSVALPSLFYREELFSTGPSPYHPGAERRVPLRTSWAVVAKHSMLFAKSTTRDTIDLDARFWDQRPGQRVLRGISLLPSHIAFVDQPHLVCFEPRKSLVAVGLAPDFRTFVKAERASVAQPRPYKARFDKE